MPLSLPQPGAMIADKYRLDAVIGEGGFAVVYRAMDESVGRPVAVKVLRPGEHGYELTLAARFVREAKLVATLSDPHTVRLFDFGRTPDGLMYLVFELIDGEDLSTLLARHTKFPPVAVEHVLRQILSALREAHAHGLLHRDIKPANIRIFEYMGDPLRAKLMDFGIARAADGQGKVTATGAVVGTMRYMSAEQLTGGRLTPASDLFSLGVVAYEMLTGERAPRDRIMLGTPPAPPVPGPLGQAVHLMLKLDPGARPQSVDDVLAILAGPRREPDLGAQRPPETPEAEPPPVPVSIKWVATVAISVVAFGVPVAWLLSGDEGAAPAVAKRTNRASAIVQRAPVADPPTPDEAAVDPERGDVGVDSGVEPVTGCNLPPLNGRLNRSVMHNLAERRFDVVTPEAYDATEPWGVIIAFHSDGASSKGLMSDAKLNEYGPEHNVIVVSVDGDGLVPWRARDVLPLTRLVLDDVRAHFCVDENRIFLLGNGSGGLAVDKVSCEPWVAGIVTMGHRAQADDFPCDPQNAVPHLNLAPLKTGHLPVEGGRGCFMESVISLEAHDRRWVERNGCKGKPRAERVRSSECFTYDCRVEFVSCHLDGGLPWPGESKRGVDVMNCDGKSADFPFFERIWAFFDRAAAWKRANAPAVR